MLLQRVRVYVLDFVDITKYLYSIQNFQACASRAKVEIFVILAVFYPEFKFDLTEKSGSPIKALGDDNHFARGSCITGYEERR